MFRDFSRFDFIGEVNQNKHTALGIGSAGFKNTKESKLETSLRRNKAFLLKWIASIFQIIGYALTGFEVIPLNSYFFIVGLVGWFLVGVIWRDRAIMLIHVVAFSALVTGLFS